jgi:hypothetical protein
MHTAPVNGVRIPLTDACSSCDACAHPRGITAYWTSSGKLCVSASSIAFAASRDDQLP